MVITMAYSWTDNGTLYTIDFEDLGLALSKYKKAVKLGVRYISIYCLTSGVVLDEKEMNRKLGLRI